MWWKFVEWFSGRPEAIWQQFPVDPTVPVDGGTYFGLTPAEWTALVLLIIKIAEIIVRKTPTDRDDTILAKITSFLKWLGIGCIVLMLVGCSSPSPMPYSMPAKAVIEGPETSAVGLPVVLDGTKSTGQVWDWECTQPHICTDNGQRLVVVPAAGQHTATLVVMSAAGGRLSRDKIQHTYTVGGPTPTPVPPGPGPNPTPIPPAPPTPPNPSPLPDGRYGLARAAYEAAMKVAIDHRGADAAKLAGAARSVSSAIAAGTLRTPVEVISIVVQRFDETLGSHVDEWAGWKREMFIKMNQNSTLRSSAEELKVGLDEIATGLEAVK